MFYQHKQFKPEINKWVALKKFQVFVVGTYPTTFQVVSMILQEKSMRPSGFFSVSGGLNPKNPKAHLILKNCLILIHKEEWEEIKTKKYS